MQLVFLLFFLITTTNSKIIVDDCVSRIIAGVFGSDETLMYLSTKRLNAMPDVSNLFLHHTVRNIPNAPVLIEYYVSYLIFAEDLHEMISVLHFFKNSTSWNPITTPRRKFVIFLWDYSDVSQVFYFLKKIYVVNVIIIQKSNESHWRASTLENFCLDRFRTVEFTCKIVRELKFAFRQKRLDGCQITASLITKASALSFWQHPELGEHGAIVKPLLFVSEKFGLDIQYDIPSTEDQLKFLSGVGTLLTTPMAKNDLIAFSPARIINNAKYYEFSDIILQDDMFWLVPKGLEVANVKVLRMIFTLNMWLVIILVMALLSVLYWIIALSAQIKEYRSWCKCALYVFTVSLGNGFYKIPASLPLKGLLCFHLLYCYHINSFFQGKLSEVLTVTRYESSIETIEELANSDLVPIVNITGLRLMISQSPHPIATRIYSKMIVLNGSITPYPIYTFRNITGLYSLSEITSMDFLLTDQFIDELNPKFEFTYMTQKGNYYVEYINEMLSVVHENGFMNFWRPGNAYNRYSLEKSRKIVLTFAHIQAAFYLFAFGHILATVIFLGELITRHLKENSK